jgi:hypothetical protein
LTLNKEFNKKIISSLFDNAIDEINKINLSADEKKKEIVNKLAQDLEGKIQRDKICMEIVKRLKDKVSDTLIRDCLPEKYKQGYRIKNAKKQKKKKQQEKEETKLAPVVVLNQQEGKEVYVEEKDKDKVAVMVGTDGKSHVQIEDQYKPSNTGAETHSDSPSKDKTFIQTLSGPQKLLKQNNNQFKAYNNRFDDELEYQNHDDISFHYFEQDDNLEKPGPLTDSENKAKITEGASVEQSDKNDKYILPFEFPINRRDIQDYLNIIDEDEVWINGTINTKTKKITHSFGRLIHQNVAVKSSINDTTIVEQAGD